MKTFAHLFGFGFLFLLLAAACQAQPAGHDSYESSKSISYSPPNNARQGRASHRGFGGYPYTQPSSGVPSLQEPSAPTQYASDYVHGDDGYVASQFVEYSQALALGREMQTSASQPKFEPSLGDVARAFRANGNSAPGYQPQ